MLIIVISATLSYFIPVLTIPFLIPSRPYSSLLSWHMRVCVCVRVCMCACVLLCLQEHGGGFIYIRTGTLSTSLEKMSLPFPPAINCLRGPSPLRDKVLMTVMGRSCAAVTCWELESAKARSRPDDSILLLSSPRIPSLPSSQPFLVVVPERWRG